MDEQYRSTPGDVGYPQPESTKGYATREVEPDRRPEVNDATDRLRKGLEGINEMVGALETRLQTVLGPERPTDPGVTPTPIRLTILGAGLHELADGFAYQERRLQDILDRLRDGL